MDAEQIKEEICAVFPEAEVGRLFYLKQNIMLEEKYGFTPDNTRFAEGGCCDEINEPEYELMEGYWGERFKFGGLAGYCHGGKTSLGAVSHHVPEVEGKKNLLLVAGPHIGYHEGQWGKVPRRGQEDITTSCGSLVAALQTGYDGIRQKPSDPLDKQQQSVEQLVIAYLKDCSDVGNSPDIVEATKGLMERIDEDMQTMVKDLKGNFDGQIALITGITINTAVGNYFSPATVVVYE